MLNQVNHWLEIGGAAVDALLLLRIFHLKLYRTYLFITMACVLSLLFDGVGLWYGFESRELSRFFIYSRFLYAFVFPAAAYDVWEEIRNQVERIRRLAFFRLVSSLLLAGIFGLIIASFAASDETVDQALLSTFAIIVWAASSTASLAFLWSMQRLVRAQKLELPRNTSVWLLFFQLSLAAEVVACFLIIVGQQFNNIVRNTLDISLDVYGISIALWCMWRLRALPSDIPSAPEKASL